MGQHFINKFIKDSSSEEMQELWNKDCVVLAAQRIERIIERNCWDYYDLPVLPKEEN